MSLKTILITGCSGFIGSHLSEKLLKNGYSVVGIDNFDDTVYSSEVKIANNKKLQKYSKFKFWEIDITDLNHDNLNLPKIDILIHFAALPGQYLSWTNFNKYLNTNLMGTKKILDFAIHNKINKIIYASTSSVYGNILNGDENFATNPISPYGITKLAAEKIILSYSNYENIKFNILRFFSVYGENQRPDMAFAKFIKQIINRNPIQINGLGDQIRDFTNIDDVVQIIEILIEKEFSNQIFNICSNNPIKLIDAINIIASKLKIEPKIQYNSKLKGDQSFTHGNNSKIINFTNFNNFKDLETGIEEQIKYEINKQI